jgi:hypothetical protein
VTEIQPRQSGNEEDNNNKTARIRELKRVSQHVGGEEKERTGIRGIMQGRRRRMKETDGVRTPCIDESTAGQERKNV